MSAPEISNSGVVANLKRQEGANIAFGFRGYDVLGFEYGAYSFHTFVCNGLDKHFQSRFNISLNVFGLITELKDARRVADYASDESSGMEPVPWFPVAVNELPLDEEYVPWAF